MKFVDRKRETEKLQKAINAAESQLIVVYGRRRVGKSTLIKEMLELGRDIYFQADETTVANQIHLLSKSITTVLPTFDTATYPDWRAILEAFNHRVQEPCTLCLDEFPYLCKSCRCLPSIIQEFWDNSSPRFNLILCGSSQQLMHSTILDEKSPLYGRCDVIMKLQPISVSHIGEAMGLTSAREAIEHYSMWGGVPRYWKLASHYETAIESLTELLLSPDGTLSDEPNRLLRDELRDISLSKSILTVIGYGAHRLTEIASRLKKPATEIMLPLRRLIDMGYVEREVPFGESPKDNKRGLYKLRDPFMNTYSHFYAPHDSLIALGRGATIARIVEKEMPTFMGSCWESLCREAVSGNEVNGVTYGMASRWWGSASDKNTGNTKQIEVDVVALSIDKKHLLVGECKWAQADYAERLLAELNKKISMMPIPKSVKHIHPVLFVRESPLGDKASGCLMPEDVIALCRN